MAHEFKMRRLVEFVETDMAGILHFSNYFRFMEQAEHAFFRSVGLSVHNESGGWGWARISAECRYQQPLRYEDTVELHVIVTGKRSKSISYDVVFRREDSTDGSLTEVARGSMTVVCIERVDGGGIRARTMPDEVDARIDVAPA